MGYPIEKGKFPAGGGGFEPPRQKPLGAGVLVEGDVDGLAYKARFIPGGGRGLVREESRVEVSIRCVSNGRLTVAREKKTDLLSKEWGFAREVQTGDADFDRDFYLSTDTDEFTAAFFRPPEKREAVRALLDLGFTAVRHDGMAFAAVKAPAGRFDLDRFQEAIPETIRALGILARDPPRTARVSRTSPGGTKANPAFPWILGGLGAFALYLGLGTFPPLDPSALVLAALVAFLPAFAAAAAFFAFRVRGRSTAPEELRRFCVRFALPILLDAGGAVFFLNGCLDPSAPAVHVAGVTARYVSHSGKSHTTHYHLTVASWRKGGSTETLEVSGDVYNSGSGDVVVTTKSGLFGFEWVRGVAPR